MSCTLIYCGCSRVVTGETHHFHVTTTVADGGVDTETASDLEGAEFTIQYVPLISTTFHPMVEFLNGWAVGNEHYIGYFDNATYKPNKIELAPGFEVRSITKQDEFIVATCFRGQAFDKAEESRLYYWDGIEPTFNFFTDVKVGVPNALFNFKNTLTGVYGNRGSVYQNDRPFQEIIDEIPKLARGKKVEVYPGAIDTFEGKLVIGYAAATDDSTGLEQGVYQYGSQTDKINPGLAMPFVISTGNTQATNQKISCVKSFGEDLYISWRDDSTFGVDKITAGDSAATTSSWEERIFDNGDPNRDKQAIKVEVKFEALAANQTVTPKYKLDRAASFTNGTAASTTGDTIATAWINTRAKEAEWGFTLASSDGSFPKITGLNFIFDDLSDEAESA